MNQSLEHVLDKAHEKKPLKEVAELSPAALRGVSDKDGEALKAAFGIKSIRDLATNKFILWAQAINTPAAAEK